MIRGGREGGREGPSSLGSPACLVCCCLPRTAGVCVCVCLFLFSLRVLHGPCCPMDDAVITTITAFNYHHHHRSMPPLG